MTMLQAGNRACNGRFEHEVAGLPMRFSVVYDRDDAASKEPRPIPERESRRKGAYSRMNSRLIAALNAAWRSVRRAQRIGGPLLTQARQMPGAAKARKVASFWDENAGKHCEPFAHWESPAPIQHALNKLVTGDISIHPPCWFMRHYGPFAHVAELGCGDGILVHVLLDNDPGLTVDAYDISTASLARPLAQCTTSRTSTSASETSGGRCGLVAICG